MHFNCIYERDIYIIIFVYASTFYRLSLMPDSGIYS